ncbi:hypothetical protein MTR_2g007445 [Medicago truncatula]|uniref:Uncharacterized protein n=1 Tax=Medicago truncatula TaxID=3880 RepID=A0A072V3N6_MEDTR|nr:hypothetical protein MTR_2g007445 [Medicago truncatula]
MEGEVETRGTTRSPRLKSHMRDKLFGKTIPWWTFQQELKLMQFPTTQKPNVVPADCRKESQSDAVGEASITEPR